MARLFLQSIRHKIFLGLTLVSCANEPESRLNRGETVDDIVPGSFIASSDQSTALMHIDSGLNLINANMGDQTGLSLTADPSEASFESLASDARGLLRGIATKVKPSGGGSLSLSSSDTTDRILKPSPGNECRDQIESIPKQYSKTIETTKTLLKTLKDLGDNKGELKDKWTITQTTKNRTDSFAYVLTEANVKSGKDPMTMEISGGSDSEEQYTAKIILKLPQSLTFHYRIFGNSKLKNVKIAAKFDLTKIPDSEDPLDPKEAKAKSQPERDSDDLKDIRADFFARLNIDMSQNPKQNLSLKGSLYTQSDKTSIDLRFNLDSDAEMLSKNQLNAQHKVRAIGRLSDQKSGTTNINFDQSANLKYEKGTDDKGPFCSINGQKAPITEVPAPKPTPKRTPNPTPGPNPTPSPVAAEDDRSFSSFTVSSWNAKYMAGGSVIRSETVEAPSINFSDKEFSPIKPQDVSVTWSGKIEIADRDQMIDFNIDNGWNQTSIKVDGKEVANWSSGPRVILQKLSVGTHAVDISFVNSSSSGIRFHASFGRNQVYTKSQLRDKLSKIRTDAPKVLVARLKSSADKTNAVKITLGESSAPVFLVLTSESTVRWSIENPKNVKILGIVFKSGTSGTSVSPISGVPVYEVSDLNYDYSNEERLKSDVADFFLSSVSLSQASASTDAFAFDK